MGLFLYVLSTLFIKFTRIKIFIFFKRKNVRQRRSGIHPKRRGQGRAHLREMGWHRLHSRSRPRDTHDLYAHAHTRDWQTLQTAQKIRANQAHQAQKSSENFRQSTLQKNVVGRLLLWWFYMELLVCWAVLWMEEKV